MDKQTKFAPTDKSEEMESFIRRVFGKDRRATIREGRCMTCGSPDMDFRDALSKREYEISGMCQKCQDLTFGE